MLPLQFGLLSFVSLFTVIDPLGALPVLVSMTSRLSHPELRRVALRAVLTAWIVLILFALAGRFVFDFFGIQEVTKMAKDTISQLEFPCVFPIKAIGRNTGDFEPKIIAIIRRHVPELRDDKVSRRLSTEGRYLAVTAVVTAESREQLDALYYDLSSHEQVLMVL